jgi:4-aminobutyrate aminotransferase-like enzyme
MSTHDELEYQSIIEKNKKYTYFSWTPQAAVTDTIAIEKAKGVYLWDYKGRNNLN